jgi:hypothetical protein
MNYCVFFEAGEDPGQKDEVGRTCPEAAVLYCDTDVSTVPVQRLLSSTVTRM